MLLFTDKESEYIILDKGYPNICEDVNDYNSVNIDFLKRSYGKTNIFLSKTDI